MLHGERVTLRARVRDDVPALHRLWSDPELHQTTDTSPWLPRSLEAAYARFDKELADEPDPKFARFAVVPRDDPDGPPVGSALLWDIDMHQRIAHVGLGLLPEARGHGYGTDTVRVLCDYGFRLRGLVRIGCETLATNTAMLGAAEKAGFTREGVLRGNALVDGERVDEVLLGILDSEWRQISPARTA